MKITLGLIVIIVLILFAFFDDKNYPTDEEDAREKNPFLPRF